MQLRQSPIAVALAFFGAWLGSARPSVAQETSTGGEGVRGAERYQLRWLREGGAEGCVSGAALARLLERIVGSRAPGQVGPLLLDGRATLAPPPLQFKVTIGVRDAV